MPRKSCKVRPAVGIQAPEWELMRDGTSTDILAELQALRIQVARLQQLVIGGESGQADAAPRTGLAWGSDSTNGADERPLYAAFFGSFRVYRKHSRIALGSSRPVCELGTYLMAHAGRAVTRDTLMDLLWPEVDPARATHRLHVAVSDLRRIVDAPGDASVVRLQDDSYQIEAGSIATDCELFEQHYQRAKRSLARGDDAAAATAFEAALHLYHGEFLADHPYLEWAAQRRAHFAERQLSALTGLCDRAARQRDYRALEEYALSILAVDSLREQAHRHLMRAHYYLGQRASAIRQYRSCAAELQRELGATPSLLTQQLHDAICHDRLLPAEIGAAE
jgi:DNA-binding SARP family transcriptional activator